jgi:hypothetical protein
VLRVAVVLPDFECPARAKRDLNYEAPSRSPMPVTVASEHPMTRIDGKAAYADSWHISESILLVESISLQQRGFEPCDDVQSIYSFPRRDCPQHPEIPRKVQPPGRDYYAGAQLSMQKRSRLSYGWWHRCGTGLYRGFW